MVDGVCVVRSTVRRTGTSCCRRVRVWNGRCIGATHARYSAAPRTARHWALHAPRALTAVVVWRWQMLRDYWSKRLPSRAVRATCSEFELYETPQAYQLKFFLEYSVPSAVFNVLNSVGVGGPNIKSLAAQFEKLVWRARVVTESFRPFIETAWHFDNQNVRHIFNALVPNERYANPSTRCYHWLPPPYL
jgi:hypothetical protein